MNEKPFQEIDEIFIQNKTFIQFTTPKKLYV
jgi:hypothetical protein